MLKVELQIDPVVQHIVDRRCQSDHFLSARTKCGSLIQFAIGRSVIAQAEIHPDGHIVIQLGTILADLQILEERQSFFTPVESESILGASILRQLIIDQAQAQLSALAPLESSRDLIGKSHIQFDQWLKSLLDGNIGHQEVRNEITGQGIAERRIPHPQWIRKQQRRIEAIHTECASITVTDREIGKDLIQSRNARQSCISNLPVGQRLDARKWICA